MNARTEQLKVALARSQHNHHTQMIRLRKEGVKTVTHHHGGWKSQCTAPSCREASYALRGMSSAKLRHTHAHHDDCQKCEAGL